jgi:hypothetical protein
MGVAMDVTIDVTFDRPMAGAKIVFEQGGLSRVGCEVWSVLKEMKSGRASQPTGSSSTKAQLLFQQAGEQASQLAAAARRHNCFSNKRASKPPNWQQQHEGTIAYPNLRLTGSPSTIVPVPRSTMA